MKQFGSFVLDDANECLWRAGARIPLQPKPFAVLRYLVEHSGRLIPYRELLNALWPQTFVQPQVLRTYVLELRKLLGDDADQPRFIRTLPKRGYCFVATVTEVCCAEGNATAGSPMPVAALPGAEEDLAELCAEIAQALVGDHRAAFVSDEGGDGGVLLCAVGSRAAALLRRRLAGVERAPETLTFS